MGHEEAASYYDMIQQCEAAIVRIRANIRAGAGSSDEVAADMEFIQQAVMLKLLGEARRISRRSPDLVEEALQAMYLRLFLDIRSLGYKSMETQLGAYLRSMTIRVLYELRRNYPGFDLSLNIEHLDDPVGEDGLPRHETIADDRAEEEINGIGARHTLSDAIAQLQPDEARVIRWRLAGLNNNEIARRLRASPATATRIYQRALKKLRDQLDATEE